MSFLNILYKVQDDIKPDCTIAAFDAGGKTFRHELLPEYKANREKLEDDFRTQLKILQEILNYSGHKVIAREGIEADDIIASLAKLAKNENYEVVILTADKDLLQLASPGVKVLRNATARINNAKFYDVETFLNEYKFMPSSMADYLAIVGDNTDNIKGVDGVGEVGAKEVLSKFSTLEEIFSHIEELDTRKRNKLKAH